MNRGLSGWYERIFAAFYDPLLKNVENQSFSPLRSRLLAGISGTVLDLGAGTGSNLPFYDRPGITPVFLDRSLPMLKKGLAKGMKTCGHPVAGSATALPFPDESFDSIVSSLVLCSVEDLFASLSEINRILKKDGTLFLMEHVLSLSPQIAALQRFATPLWKTVAGGCHLDRATDTVVRTLFIEESSWQETIGGLPFHFGRYTKRL